MWQCLCIVRVVGDTRGPLRVFLPRWFRGSKFFVRGVYIPYASLKWFLRYNKYYQYIYEAGDNIFLPKCIKSFLISRLNSCGVDGICAKLIKNYKSCHSCSTGSYNQPVSVYWDISGLKGSILGPLLFIIYINNIHEANINSMLDYMMATQIRMITDRILQRKFERGWLW